MSSEVRYLYDGRRVIQERNSGNTPTVTYTRGPDLSGSFEGAGGIGGLLARSHGYSSGNWTTHNFYHADGGGNITNNHASAAAVVASYRYDPFGRTLSQSGTMAAANLYRFSSKEIHVQSGMYGYGFRFYDPHLQRWLNRDPIFEAGGINLYQFASNDSANAFDPFGLDEHHYVTGPIRYDPNVSPDARKVFRDCTTGDVGKHDYSKPHPSYNKAVQEQWDGWITGKDKGKLTADQAREVVDKVKSSTDPRIKPFLDDLHNRALKQARKKLAQKAVARIAKKVGPAVAAGCFIYDWNEGGIIHAVDEAVWPLSELW